MSDRTAAPAPAPAPAPHILYVHFHAPADTSLHARVYEMLLGLLRGITPVVQALPPDAALADVRSALRYFDRDAAALADLIRVRALALHGVDSTIGVGPNPLLARMAAADGPPGAVRILSGDERAIAAFLRHKPVTLLYGVGPASARTLAGYGLDTIGRIAGTSLGTLQRVLGATAGRNLHDRARGIDPTPVVQGAPARSIGGERRFGQDELDPVRHRRALLSLTEELGARLRTESQAARSLTLTVRYADRSATTRTRTLRESSGHSAALRTTAYQLYDTLGLQRARVRAISLRADGLLAEELTARQLSLEPGDDKARLIEAAADRARARFGPAAVHPAGTAHPATPGPARVTPPPPEPVAHDGWHGYS
ncbi:hypothetical protein QMK19_02400 [Streptomyces sp. H10-C2]|uniref:DNA polymerase Y family protein n=1 Tax=unclassified Streptomyces TaxID=2593676 RepID=UPI0024B9F675|nr:MULTISPECIES: hypothetical protein [unclassified Streptomyces]MDJ0347524.1 hypothetical protein [Streptomyces sp. PH10-H1]MDJ0368559.1 hypothetical protein [Streptomyces sp. H10-C2]